MFTDLAEKNLGGHWVIDVYLFLIVSGSFACALAFHNAASRYIYAIGREVPAAEQNTSARPTATHHSPHIASIVQSADHPGAHRRLLRPDAERPRPVLQGGYIYLYGLLALLGTMSILAGPGHLLARGHLVLLGEEDAHGQRLHDADRPALGHGSGCST